MGESCRSREYRPNAVRSVLMTDVYYMAKLENFSA